MKLFTSQKILICTILKMVNIDRTIRVLFLLVDFNHPSVKCGQEKEKKKEKKKRFLKK
jgi:hypothetical protein